MIDEYNESEVLKGSRRESKKRRGEGRRGEKGS